MGLLLAHKRKLKVWGDMLSVSLIGDSEKVGGGKRGEISVFSADSRFRLFRTLHQLEFKRVTFMTLTYPGEFPTDKRIYKGHLKEFRRRFEKAYGKISAVWRLEFQERGAPHFHIMFLDCPFVGVKDLCWMWKCVTHTWDMAHELLGVDVKLVTDRSEKRLIAKYLGKYIAKVDERKVKNDTRDVGRYWGKWNIVDPQPVEYEIGDWEAGRIVGVILGSDLASTTWRPVDPTMCTVFGDCMGGGEFGQFVRGYKDHILGQSD
jgi:hypothetical protein